MSAALSLLTTYLQLHSGSLVIAWVADNAAYMAAISMQAWTGVPARTWCRCSSRCAASALCSSSHTTSGSLRLWWTMPGRCSMVGRSSTADRTSQCQPSTYMRDGPLKIKLICVSSCFAALRAVARPTFCVRAHSCSPQKHVHGFSISLIFVLLLSENWRPMQKARTLYTAVYCNSGVRGVAGSKFNTPHCAHETHAFRGLQAWISMKPKRPRVSCCSAVCLRHRLKCNPRSASHSAAVRILHGCCWKEMLVM
jgi:hypothetical protein